MNVRYLEVLDYLRGVSLFVDFRTERGRVVAYRLVLLLSDTGGTETIRVYDSAHGLNEMHRYTPAGGKQTGETFHSGTLGEGVQIALSEVKKRYLRMIEGWSG